MAIKEVTTDKKVVLSILWFNLSEFNENNLDLIIKFLYFYNLTQVNLFDTCLTAYYLY